MKVKQITSLYKLSQKLIVKKGQATCPCCHTKLDVISKVNGLGSKPQGDKHLRKITKGYKIEIICAYLNNATRPQTTGNIITIMNKARGMNNQIERSNITRAHSELLDAGILINEFKSGYDTYYSVDVIKAQALLNGE